MAGSGVGNSGAGSSLPRSPGSGQSGAFGCGPGPAVAPGLNVPRFLPWLSPAVCWLSGPACPSLLLILLLTVIALEWRSLIRTAIVGRGVAADILAEVRVRGLGALDSTPDVVGAILLALLRRMMRAVCPQV